MFMGVGCLASGLFCGLRVYCGDRAAGATEKKYADVRGARLSDGTKENALRKKASPIPRQTQAGTREKRNAIMVRERPMPALQSFAVIHFSCQLYFPRRRKLSAGVDGALVNNAVSVSLTTFSQKGLIGLGCSLVGKNPTSWISFPES
jgi:hypothetical protein